MRKVRKSKRMSKADQKKYIIGAARRYGKIQLIFGYVNDDEVVHDLIRVIDKTGYSKYKFGGDRSYMDSCFMYEYLYNYKTEEHDWDRLSIKKTVNAMYAYDRHDSVPLVEVRTGRNFSKVLKKFA